MAPLAKKLNEKLDEKFNYADYLTWPDIVPLYIL